MTEPSLARTVEVAGGALRSRSSGSLSNMPIESLTTAPAMAVAGMKRPATSTPHTVPAAMKARTARQRDRLAGIGMLPGRGGGLSVAGGPGVADGGGVDGGRRV